MTRLLVVRHAESTWNAERRWQGRADPPLSEVGRRQAVAARTGAAGEGVQAVWASPLRRARQTAEILAEALAVPLATHDGLVERDAGPWTGLTRAEIDTRWPGHLDAGRRPPGYESDASVVARAHTALEVVRAEAQGGTVLVITHGGLIRALERELGVDGGVVPNLGGRVLHPAAGGFRPGSRLLLLDGSVPLTRPGMC